MMQRLPLSMTLITLIVALLTAQSAQARQVVTGADIKEAILEQLQNENISAKPIVSDRRRFYACASPLHVTPRFADSWETARVSCTDPENTWHVLVRTEVLMPQVSETQIQTSDEGPKGVVLLASVKKGAVLTEDILSLTQLPPGRRLGAFFRLEDVIGRRAKQNLSALQPLKARHLEFNWAVEAGQTAMIVKNVGGFEVSTAGKVLENAQIGDIIRVENIKSGKKINAMVESSKKVSPISNTN